MIKKICFKCGIEKYISLFYPHKQMADGYLGKCKECAKKDATNHRNGNIEKVRAYDRQRSKLPHRLKFNKENSKRYREKYPLRVKASTERYRKTYPLKYAATNILNNAIRDGKVKKPKKCSKCCKEKKIQGHHPDYYKPLDVIWVCQICHKKIHKEK